MSIDFEFLLETNNQTALVDDVINIIDKIEPSQQLSKLRKRLVQHRQTFSLTLKTPTCTWGPCSIMTRRDMNDWLNMGGDPSISEISCFNITSSQLVFFSSLHSGIKLKVVMGDSLQLDNIEQIWLDSLNISEVNDSCWLMIPCRKLIIDDYNAANLPIQPNIHVEELTIKEYLSLTISGIQRVFPNLLSFDIGDCCDMAFDCPISIPTIKGFLSYAEYLELVKVSEGVENVDIVVFVDAFSDPFPPFPPNSKFYQVKFVNISSEQGAEKHVTTLAKGNVETLLKIVSTYYLKVK
jgi:hypothetical protein